jgi:hypothetical protein
VKVFELSVWLCAGFSSVRRIFGRDRLFRGSYRLLEALIGAYNPSLNNSELASIKKLLLKELQN